MEKINPIELDDIFKEVLDSNPGKIIFITEKNVWDLYGKHFPIQGTDRCCLWIAPSGENAKKFTVLEAGLNAILEMSPTRDSHIVALGGGALTDLAGLIASLILRGISWSTIPTTLLSMADAAIGGKTAINSAHGKNLVGTFHRPDTVYICTKFLDSLPRDQYESGLGEIIKYAFLDNSLDIINSSLPEVILSCANYKLSIVNEDAKEGGRRKVLNLGHTIGHALEKQFNIPHGIAVIWGLAWIFIIYDLETDLDLLRTFVNQFKITTFNPFNFNKGDEDENFEAIKSYLTIDKKVFSDHKITIVLPGGKLEDVELSGLVSQIENKRDILANFKF